MKTKQFKFEVIIEGDLTTPDIQSTSTKKMDEIAEQYYNHQLESISNQILDSICVSNFSQVESKIDKNYVFNPIQVKTKKI